MYPLNAPDLADLIDGSIGELSPFQDRFGYYAQGVGPETAVLPKDWENRLVKIQNQNTDLKIGYCLDTHDLAASKLAAARDKDREFVMSMIEYGFIARETLCERLEGLPLDKKQIDALLTWVDSRFRSH